MDAPAGGRQIKLGAARGRCRLILSRDGRLILSNERLRYRIGGYGRVRQRLTLRVRFLKRGGVYRLRGSYRVRSLVIRHGRRFTTCSATRKLSGKLTRAGA